MAFTPDSVCRLLENVPLDSTYTDTRDFASKAVQTSYFDAKKVIQYSGITYVRAENTGKQYVRVGAVADKLYNVNYMMFQNTNFGTKWFYAFVTKVEYVNQNTSNVYFELDVLQTWMFDYTLLECFVERESVIDDTFGKYNLQEPIDIGLINYKEIQFESKCKEYVYIVALASKFVGAGSIPPSYCGVFSGLDLYKFNNTMQDETAMANFISKQEEQKQGVVQWIACVPRLAIDSAIIESDHHILRFDDVPRVQFNINHKIDFLPSGYKPYNRKLFTFPFNFLVCSNHQNNTITLKYELFPTSLLTFTLYCDLSAAPTLRLVPTNYEGVTNNYDAGLSRNYNLQCSFSVNTYQQWLQSNQISFAIQSAGAVASVASGNVVGGVLAVANMANSDYKASLQSPNVKGSQGGALLDTAIKINDYIIKEGYLSAYDAERIDMFFQKFGYNVSEVKVPRPRSLGSWNYIKTRDCSIKGSIPSPDMDKIKSIFNRGITFWHDDDIGNYHRSNAFG